jgi:hypothetical protein
MKFFLVRILELFILTATLIPLFVIVSILWLFTSGVFSEKNFSPSSISSDK